MSIEQSSDFLQEFANDALSRATRLSNRIASTSSLGQGVKFNFDPTKPSISRPPPIGDLMGEDNKSESIQFLNAETDKLVSKFFPNLDSCLQYQPEEWACGILTGQKPFGLSREVFEAVWQEGRDRAYRGANTEQAQIRAEYSLRGFSIPPGAMIAASRNAEIRASEAIADVNRTQMLRDAEIKLDLVKFAATTAAQLKTGLLGVLANFYGNWIRVVGQGQDLARAKAQAYSALVSGLSSYYNVELGFEELRLKAAQGKMDAEKSTADLNAKVGDIRAAESRALAQAADAFAQAAGAAANAQSSLQAELYSGVLGS